MTASISYPASAAAAQSPAAGRKLLIVDDQRATTRLVASVAAGLGFETMAVNDASIATDSFISFRPDVLVLDLVMPEKDGLDVLNEVLLLDPDLNVVLISGYGDAWLELGQSVSEFHRRGTTEVLHKPFRAETLRATLSRLIGTAPAG
jgi:DNA-binding NtrC family response regulator